jgi:hypothetical protein
MVVCDALGLALLRLMVSFFKLSLLGLNLQLDSSQVGSRSAIKDYD